MKSLSILFLLFFYLNVISVLSQVPSYVPTSGLVGWWPFNGNANDESGNGNNGTVNGASLTSDRFGGFNKAYNFDGVDDFIEFGDIQSLNNSNAFSVSVFFNYNNLPSFPNDWYTVVADGSYADLDGWGILIKSDQILMRELDNFNGLILNYNFSLNNWYHITATCESDSIKLFINGQFLGGYFNLQPNLTLNTSNSFRVGNGTMNNVPPNSHPYYFSGKIDDIGLWNRALTQQEITNLYTSSVPPTITTSASSSLINCGESSTLTASSTSAVQPCAKADLPATLQNGLVGYWPFCGNANDASGNNNNGTVNGATLTTDRFGNAGSAYSFDGNDYIEVPDNATLNNSNISIGLWIKTNSNLFQQVLYKVSLNTAQNEEYSIPINLLSPNQINFDIKNNTCLPGIGWMSFTNNANLSNWVHVSFTHDGSITKFYLNGNLINSQVANYNVANCPGGKLIMGITWELQNGLNGLLDDIAIYNRALTASEIQQLYNLGNVSYSWSTGATTPSISVGPTQTTSYACTATNSAGSTTSSVTVTVADTLTWTGAVDTDWHKACNWSPEFVPKCCNSVKIPLTTNQPIIAGVAASKDITIQTTSGALLTVNNGANLQIQDCPTVSTTNTCPVLAQLTTTTASSITQTTAVSGGTITYQGSSTITARGVCWSTSPNPTLSNSFSSNGSGIGTFTSNLVGLTGGTTYYVRAYATNGSGTSYGNQVSFVSQTLAGQYPAGSVFCTSGPTAIVDVTNPATGKIWMDRNLGASQVATSSTDAAAYGDLYQWGRKSDGHQCRNSATTTILSSTSLPVHGDFILTPATPPYDWQSPQNTNLWQGLNGVNNPCPDGYRIPTDAELNSDKNSWSDNTYIGAFASPLKFTIGGRRDGFGAGSIMFVGSSGCYWSSSINLTNSKALNIGISGSGITTTFYRWRGLTIRCIKN